MLLSTVIDTTDGSRRSAIAAKPSSRFASATVRSASAALDIVRAAPALTAGSAAHTRCKPNALTARAAAAAASVAPRRTLRRAHGPSFIGLILHHDIISGTSGPKGLLSHSFVRFLLFSRFPHSGRKG